MLRACLCVCVSVCVDEIVKVSIWFPPTVEEAADTQRFHPPEVCFLSKRASSAASDRKRSGSSRTRRGPGPPTAPSSPGPVGDLFVPLVRMRQESGEKGKGCYFPEQITQLWRWPGGRRRFQSHLSDVNVSEPFIYFSSTRTPPSLTAQCPFFVWQRSGITGRVTGGFVWTRTWWRYAREVEKKQETRMYCKISLFVLFNVRWFEKKRKITKSSCLSSFTCRCHTI